MTQSEFATLFEEAVSPAGLSGTAARRAFDAILAGTWSVPQVAGFISALRAKGETQEVIASAAQSMRQAMLSVPHDFPQLLDTCGTGGDGSGTVNLSTGAAIIVTAAGIPVAKHGNRAVSSKAGSADVLAALGIPLDLSATQAAQVLKEAKISFLLAPTHHPAMRHAMPARKELGVRTIFNCLGPLCNPARATHQVIGVFSDALRPIIANTLKELGSQAAWVVRGEDGLDEISPYGATRVAELRQGSVKEWLVTPEDFGLARSPAGAAQGGEAVENARIIEAVLANQPHPARDAFLLNAAAALVVADAIPYQEATARARNALESGAAAKALESWRQACRSAVSVEAVSG
jgi:anthranilate phosphoribosyltransferase